MLRIVLCVKIVVFSLSYGGTRALSYGGTGRFFIDVFNIFYYEF